MFQDFNHLSERRKAERAAKRRKKILIALGLIVTILLVIAASVLSVIYITKNNEKAKKTEDGAGARVANDVSRLQKAVKMICSPTDYKKTCETSLTKAMQKKKGASNPTEIIKSAVHVIVDEIVKAFNSSIKGKIEDPKVKGAIEDCQTLLRDAKEELAETVAQMSGSLEKISSKSPDMQNWLSAVMSYQQTCIDGFPEGELKTTLQKAMKEGKELTSNALAIVSEVSSFLKNFKIPGSTQRRLLQKEVPIDSDGFPIWMTQEDRRWLKEDDEKKLPPNVVVAKDGSGQFKTINEALAAMPKDNKGRYIIYVKEGIYDETVIIEKKMINLVMYGDGSMKTVVTGSKNFVDGVRTFQTATFAVLGDGFVGKSMGFRNTAGPEKHQAVALRVQADRAIFHNCRMDGYQDTLYAQTHRQFYRSCVITGTVDFIFGDAAAVIQNTQIFVRRPLDNQQNIVTAQGRLDKRQTTGLVIHNCKILADDKLAPEKEKFKSYLGRPWKEFSRTIIMESEIGDHIHPDGWLPWEGDFALKTLFYAEYQNTGPGAKTTARVKWPGYKVINKADALKFTVGPFLHGETWIREAGVPARIGLYH